MNEVREVDPDQGALLNEIVNLFLHSVFAPSAVKSPLSSTVTLWVLPIGLGGASDSIALKHIYYSLVQAYIEQFLLV